MRIYISVAVLFLFVQIGWAQHRTIQPELIKKVEKIASQIIVGEPNYMDPLAMNASLVWSEDKSQLAVIIKATLLDSWHIYAYVPKTQPYIASELRLNLPKGIIPLKDWEEPNSYPYEKGIYIYKETLVFVRYCSVEDFNKEETIKTGIYYQTCDVNKCFPPITKAQTLNL